MKAKAILLAAVLGAAALPAAAESRGDIGVGVIAGDPTGGTAKLWLDGVTAVDAGVGFSGDTALWATLLVHAWDLLPQPTEGRLAGYLGAGPRLEAGHDAEFGVRTIAGVAWRLNKHPLEFFMEAGPVFRMTPRGGVDVDGGLGLRVYLGKAGR
jgi:hypothetical protein